MKLRVLTVGLLTCLTLGLSFNEASAEPEWSTPCKVNKPYENPTFQQVNCLLTNAAIDANIPPEVVKAVAKQESDWKQFDENGKPIISTDGGIGIMQITNKDNYNEEKLKYDIYFNINAGIEILNSMYDRKDLPKIKGAGREVVENWYFPVMAYNGTKPVNSPLYQLTGKKNDDAYQEKVFGHIEQYSFLNSGFLENPILGEYPFKTTDFQYDTTSDNNIEFLKKEYTLTDQMHTSSHLFNKGDKVVVTQDKVNLRKSITTSTGAKKLAKNTTLIISDTFKYDNNNQFVWYPVKTADSKLEGYISSAYITKKQTTPSIKAVDDNDTSISGTAPAKATIKIMRGKTKIGSVTANSSGKFIVKISKQKAGTKLTVTYKDGLNTPIPSKTVKVIDKTAPKSPTVHTIKKTSKTVTGKTEAYATVQLKFGSRTSYSGKANKYGTFKISIKPQKAGTNVYVTAKDTAKNTSKVTKTKVK